MAKERLPGGAGFFPSTVLRHKASQWAGPKIVNAKTFCTEENEVHDKLYVFGGRFRAWQQSNLPNEQFNDWAALLDII